MNFDVIGVAAVAKYLLALIAPLLVQDA